MYKIICVTNRKLCQGDFLEQIQKIALAKPDKIIVREKDLSEEEYTALLREVVKIGEVNSVEIVAHSFIDSAQELGVRSIHLPLDKLRRMSEDDKQFFQNIGASCHSKEDAREALALGANYIVAGHIFETDCKKGLAGRGLDFLHEVYTVTPVPVYAIGGIRPENAQEVVKAGASGVCIMSGFMRSQSPEKLIQLLRPNQSE